MENYDYSDILELLHSEKYNPELQLLTKEQFTKIQQYMDAKQALFEKATSKELKFKLQMEIENAERAIRDLYSKREQKIINRSIFAARSDFKLKDTTNMLLKEEIFYSQLIELLISNQKNFYTTLQNLQSTPLAIEQSLKTAHKTLKFKEAVPELLDLKENKHGPFQPNDTAELPNELAQILVAQKKAEIVETK
jgi:DNA replication initiation complex subunit (GINS family)